MDDRELREAHNQYGDAITLCKAASLGDKWGVYAMLSTYSRTDERGDLVLALAFVASNLARDVGRSDQRRKPDHVLRFHDARHPPRRPRKERVMSPVQIVRFVVQHPPAAEVEARRRARQLHTLAVAQAKRKAAKK